MKQSVEKQQASYIRQAERAADHCQYGRARRLFRLAGYSYDDIVTFYDVEMARAIQSHAEDENLGTDDAVIVGLTFNELKRRLERTPLPAPTREQRAAIEEAKKDGAKAGTMISGAELAGWRASRVWTASRGWANAEWVGPCEI